MLRSPVLSLYQCPGSVEEVEFSRGTRIWITWILLSTEQTGDGGHRVRAFQRPECRRACGLRWKKRNLEEKLHEVSWRNDVRGMLAAGLWALEGCSDGIKVENW